MKIAILALLTILSACAADIPAPPEGSVYPSGIEQWHKCDTKMAQWVRDSVRIRFTGGLYVPELRDVETPNEEWIPMFEGDKGFDSLDWAQFKVKQAFQIEIAVTDSFERVLSSPEKEVSRQ